MLTGVRRRAQDLSGAAVTRFAAAHPESVRSVTAVETGLAGFGLEAPDRLAEALLRFVADLDAQAAGRTAGGADRTATEPARP
ncbi:hypothetical protein [Cellulomonas sp. KH9]|uniref:hypothetical protein n=1 Tax=Cellulomonas sp. KH9 TaxID=1855324 RepID=UPI000B7D5A5B|nr:hypothetical protein [Cellulomonas sp. KH9]